MSIVVLGDLVTDVVVRPSEPPARGGDTSSEVRLTGGGAAANVACWLASTGVATHLVARVGDDAAGRERRAELEQAGVEAHLAADPAVRTGSIVVLVDPDGQRTMLTDRGANARLEPRDVPAGLVERAAWLHVSGYALLEEGSRPAARAALDRAHRRGVPVSVDPASARPLRRAGAARFLSWVEGVRLLLPNREEAAVLTGCAEPADAAVALAERCGEAVVTLGPGGVVWSDGARVVQRAARRADVVDTTGAGDAFTAGYLAARLAGSSPQAGCDAGLALAARAVSRMGARPG